MWEMHPNMNEIKVLNLFYNRFYNLFDEINQDSFLYIDSNLKFYKLREIFSIYKELLYYKPIREYINYIKNWWKPPLDWIIVDDLFSFIRNLLSHFPLFNNWNEVYINKSLATWNGKWTIHKFLQKSVNIKIDWKWEIKYRIWESEKRKMTYISVFFPENYNNDELIYLKDIISENDGIKLCISFMKEVLDTQVDWKIWPDIKIMSQVYY